MGHAWMFSKNERTTINERVSLLFFHSLPAPTDARWTRVCSTRRVGRWGVCTIVRTKRISLMWTTLVPVCVNFTNALSRFARLRTTISTLTLVSGASVRGWVPRGIFWALSGRSQPFQGDRRRVVFTLFHPAAGTTRGCGWGRRRGRCFLLWQHTLAERNGGVDA